MEAFASDLNPVACLILEVMLEEVPRHGPELVDGLRRAGAVIRKTAERKLVDLYPIDPDGATPIAYLRTRTVRYEALGCGVEIPLVWSMWLRKYEMTTFGNESMQRLQGEGVCGADLIFACMGPALEIFSRYSRVETAAGREVGLSEYLKKFREAAGREALRHGGDA